MYKQTENGIEHVNGEETNIVLWISKKNRGFASDNDIENLNRFKVWLNGTGDSKPYSHYSYNSFMEEVEKGYQANKDKPAAWYAITIPAYDALRICETMQQCLFDGDHKHRQVVADAMRIWENSLRGKNSDLLLSFNCFIQFV